MEAGRSRRSGGSGISWPLAGLIGALALLMPFLAIATDGNVAVTMAPAAAIGLLALLWNVPLRYPVLALFFFGLTLENPGDGFASGLWKSPLYVAGALLLTHWNTVVSFKPLVLSGVDLALLLFFAIAIHRRATRSPIDGPSFVAAASPLRFFSAATIAGGFWLEAWGTARGDMDFRNSLWQVQHVAYLPLLFFLLEYAIRGPRDYAALGKTIISAACVRATMAVLVRRFVTPNSYEAMPTATSHPDSMLFAGAFCLCVVLALETRSRKHWQLCAVVLPILVLGMIANNRRLVWVQIAMALLALYFVSPMSKVKLNVVRGVIVGIPVFAAYLIAGWESQGGGLFKVARMVRSVVDSKSDASSEWRDWENFDLVYTLRSSPLLGIGYGHPYLQEVKLPEVAYDQESFLPHNSVLGLWAYGGLVGFTLAWMMIAVGAFFAVRSYRMATRREDRAAALASLMMLVIYVAHCFGDLGLGVWTSVFLVSAALVVVGKLALTTGAWPSRIRTSPSEPAP